MRIKEITNESIYPSARVKNKRHQKLVRYLAKNSLKKPYSPEEMAIALQDLGAQQHKIDKSYEKTLERLLAQVRHMNR